MLVKKLRELGVLSMSLRSYSQLPDPEVPFQIAQDVKLSLTSSEPCRGLPVIINHPGSPDGLPQPIKDKAFQSGPHGKPPRPAQPRFETNSL